MSSDKPEPLNDIHKRIQEEIIPLFEKVLSEEALHFPNPNILKCREVMDCESPDCLLYGGENGSVRCWHSSAPCCKVKLKDDSIGRFNLCLGCKVLKDSCPTVIEEIGEYIQIISLIMEGLRQKIIEDGDYISEITRQLSAVSDLLALREREIQEIMITDKLTTLFNRHHLVTVLEDEIARCQRYGRPLALIMMDIDGFRSFNDSYGHQTGDAMLSFVGTLIKDNTRKFDRAFRYGGEEFVVVLPESDVTMAYIVSERIRKGFEANFFTVKERESGEYKNVSRTLSVGITATFAYGTQDISVEELISQSEKALSTAKDKGGNICIKYE